jgi:hypothetical protein
VASEAVPWGPDRRDPGRWVIAANCAGFVLIERGPTLSRSRPDHFALAGALSCTLPLEAAVVS